MMMNRELEAFSRSQVVGVIESFSIEEDGKSVGFSNLGTRPDVDVFFSEKFPPKWKMIERSIEVELRFDDGTNADVGSEVRVEV